MTSIAPCATMTGQLMWSRPGGDVDHDRVPQGGPETGLVGESVLHGERIGWGGLPRHGAHPGE
jgi:hypothetical protein